MNIFARQGDLVIAVSTIADTDLTKEVNMVLAGRDSAPHILRGTVLAKVVGRTTVVRVLEPTLLTHDGRHKDILLAPADYSISRLRERNGFDDVDVQD
jgi:hypothetical protein